MRSFDLKTAVAAVSLVAAGAATAATTTSTFTVNATVIGTCSVSATDHAFGNYDPLAATPADSSSNVAVTCTQTTSYSVGLSAGSGSGATVATRRMTKDTTTLDYSLYKDSGRAQVWGDTGTDMVSGTGSGTVQNYPVYGRIPINQNVDPGTYSDSITVTVTF